jgi:PAS domain S-box-containing protein
LLQQQEDLRLAQLELAKSRDRFFALHEFAPVGLITINESGRIQDCNVKAATMLGVDSEALQRKSLATFFSPPFRRAWNRHRQAMFSRGARRPFEIQIRREDGTHLDVRFENSLLGRGDERRCIIALIDITAQKSLEQGLARLNNELERRIQQETGHIRLQAEAISHLGEGVMITRGRDWKDSTILFVNDAMCQMSGYPAEELISQPQSILQGKRTQSKLSRAQRELAAGRQSRVKLVQYRNDGRPYEAELTISPLPHPGGLTTFVSVQRDVTAQKRTEETLDKYRKNLKIIASEVMLAEERERQRLAEELHDGLSQALFSARMKLDELSLTQPEVREVAAILEEIGKMASAMTFELSPIVLYRLGLRPAIKSLAAYMRQHYGISVEIHDDNRQEIVLPERMALAVFRSIRELLINIAKHAKTDTARLSLRRIDDTLQIEIEDKGKGFDLADLSHHVESGHFGLFSLRERLEYLGGAFYIRSTLGEGTTVILNAPLATRRAASGSGQRR